MFRKAILLMPEEDKHWSKLLDHISYTRKNLSYRTILESAIGTYRIELGEFTALSTIINNQLYDKAQNQFGLFYYPTSDSVFVSAFKNVDKFDFVQLTCIRNRQNEIIKVRSEQWSGSDYFSNISWKEDTMILMAKDFLESGQASDALSTFHKAYDQHPEHYYLDNYIQHLELI